MSYKRLEYGGLKRELRNRLRPRLVGRVRGVAGEEYALEAAERILRLGRTTHTKVALRVPEQQRPELERIVREVLLEGGWPGHIQGLVDRLEDGGGLAADLAGVVPIHARRAPFPDRRGGGGGTAA